MFQFDEEWDPEEERRDDDEYRRILAEQKAGGAQQKVEDGEQKAGSLYDDYFAMDRAELMPTGQQVQAGQQHQAGQSRQQQQMLRFIEHPQSEWIVRSRPAQLSCTALNAKWIRVKCNAKWLDESRVRLEQSHDPSSANSTALRANAHIQRAELDAWLADLGEFACQCWAFADTAADSGQVKMAEKRTKTEEEEEEDEEEDEEDSEEEQDELEMYKKAGPSTSSGPPQGAVIRSEMARIRLAYLRKHFHQVPIGQRVHEGRTVQLQCQPPDGDPKAEIFWHKNGQQLHFPSPSDEHNANNNAVDDPMGSQNLVLAADGSLILSAARLSDTGNYSCEARNPANRRFTEPAEIAVYVDGDWSPWTDWEGHCANVLQDCPVLQSQLAMVRGDVDAVQRVLPRQRRIRTCNNPASLNGGQDCQGPSEEFRECDHGCRFDGAWTQWSPWARQCDGQCRRERRRECSAPAPANGGLECAGPGQQWRNCSSASQDGLPVPAHCLPSRAGHLPAIVPTPASPQSTGTSRALFDSQLLALASLGCVAFLLLVIALLAALLFCARKKRGKAKGRLDTGAHCGAGIFLDREEKLYFPGAAVATTAEDELGNVRTVLLDQKLLDSLGPSPAHYGPGTPGSAALGRFFSLKPGHGTPLMASALHPTVSTPPATARLAAFLHSPNSYTLRSWSSSNARQQHQQQQQQQDGAATGVVQPYASGPIRAGSRQQQHMQHYQDVAGSRVALLPEYSSSSQGSNRTAAGRHSIRHCSGRPAPEEEEEEENNYATLYEELGRRTLAVALSTESMAADESSSGPDYALSSSAGTQPCGGGRSEEGGSATTGTGATFVAVEVDAESARIELRRSGAALTIGEGCFPEPCTIFLSVSDDAADRPPELGGEEEETWLSSTVSFGLCDQRRHVQLERPVVLSVEHCASLFPKQHSWLFSVWAQLDGCQQWTRAWQEEAGSAEHQPVHQQQEQLFGLHMERQRWHLVTSRMGRFLLVGRQRRAHVAAQKRVHLSAYWTPSTPSKGLPPALAPPPPPPRPERPDGYDRVPIGSLQLAQIRVYCVPETAMAIESVRQQEKRRLGGLLLAEADNFLLQPRGPLCCCLEQIGFPRGEAHPTSGSQYLEIPDQLHRWCAQNGLHFQLNIAGMLSSQHSGPAGNCGPRSMQGRLVLYQKGNSAGERQVLGFSLDADNLEMSQQQIGREDSELSRLSAFDSTSPLELYNCASAPFQLSPQVRVQLAQLLEADQQQQQQQNWQALAQKLGLQRQIPFLLDQPGSALCLLELWEAINGGSERAPLDLLQSLRVLGRPDAVQLLELFLAEQQQQQCPRAPFCSLNVSPEESRQELQAMMKPSGRMHRATSD